MRTHTHTHTCTHTQHTHTHIHVQAAQDTLSSPLIHDAPRLGDVIASYHAFITDRLALLPRPLPSDLEEMIDMDQELRMIDRRTCL